MITIIALIIPNLIIILLFHKTDNYKYFVELIKNRIYNIKNKKVKIRGGEK